ncbi:hypothetical protein LEP1GSC185_3674 [Leptospira licerasiae serovar Varillal str. VAR 010]|nr:hypothetical protein LEP1GSC185_3674 [Leptospira licerasiae serovar Varillal str. VAR 010]
MKLYFSKKSGNSYWNFRRLNRHIIRSRPGQIFGKKDLKELG